jgi:hypothetical protein
MIERFTPNNPFEADATIASLRWLDWLPRKESVLTWSLCAGAAAAVLIIPRFRAWAPLRGLAVLILVAALALSFAGGNVISARYFLIFLPLLSIVGACVLVHLMPRPVYAGLGSMIVLALSFPSLARIPHDTTPAAPSDLIEISRSYGGDRLHNEISVFVKSPPDRSFFPYAFCYHAGLSRLVWVDHDNLNGLNGRAPEAGAAHPLSGAVHSDYLPDVERTLGPVVKVVEVGSYVAWRQGSGESAGISIQDIRERPLSVKDH